MNKAPFLLTALILLSYPGFSQAESLIKHVRVLCYHHVQPSLAGHNPNYTIDTASFETHMRMLSDSGYQTILPNQLTMSGPAAGLRDKKLVMLTFDDGHQEHYTAVLPILNRFNFKGVFFIPTVIINKRGYLSEDEIAALSNAGHEIGAHSHDHPDMRQLSDSAYILQIHWAGHRLEQLTGTPIRSFAYPYGLWNEKLIARVQAGGMNSAYILGGPHSLKHPEMTIRRILVCGDWPASKLARLMN